MYKMIIRIGATHGEVTDVVEGKTFEANFNEKKERHLVSKVAQRVVEVGKEG